MTTQRQYIFRLILVTLKRACWVFKDEAKAYVIFEGAEVRARANTSSLRLSLQYFVL